MQTFLLVSVLTALVIAVPYPQATETSIAPGATLISLSAILPSPTATSPDSTSLDIPITSVPTPDPDPEDDEDPESSSSKKNPHWEPIPIFTKPCKSVWTIDGASSVPNATRSDSNASTRAVTSKRTSRMVVTCKLWVDVQHQHVSVAIFSNLPLVPDLTRVNLAPTLLF
ncbi:hypothetical protein AALT_g1379 [Alternaria alternata]|nr:hypothetical protein AALT_g1379 [Alternaria alternata]